MVRLKPTNRTGCYAYVTHFTCSNVGVAQTSHSILVTRKHLLRTERVVSAESTLRELSATHRMMPLSVAIRVFMVSVLFVWFLSFSVTITWNLPFWLTFCMLCIHEIRCVGDPKEVQLNVALCWKPSATAVTTGCGGATILGGSKAVWTKELCGMQSELVILGIQV